MNAKKITKITLLSLLVLCVAFALYIMISKGFFQDPANFMQLAKNKVTKIYNDVTNTEPTVQEEIITTADGHKVLLDHPKGYSLSFPVHMQFDLSISPEQIKVYDDDMTVIITREWAPYEDVEWYIDNYMNQYYLNEYYQESNNITLLENTKYEHNGAKAQFISLRRDPEEQHIERQNHYSYFFVHSQTGQQAFFRVMFKTKDYEKSAPVIQEIINSFEEIKIEGENIFKHEYKPVVPDTWNEETKKLWHEVTDEDDFKWGIFVDGAYQIDRNYQWLVDLEKKVDFQFDFSLHYVNLNDGFPTEELQKAYADGKFMEMTLQTSNFNNEDLFGKNLNFDIYDGLLDDQIREFARGAKEFGHPFLFRLNNEMNSDWVNYSGVAALSDPEIFIENWRRIYDIFQEEGVDNAIWIFNPNAEDCPPAHWNSYISYYPGDGYAQMIGMTGYNTGEYYKELYHEKWRTFDEIYQEPYEKYMNLFGEFPFIITEFASSSVGGDKAAWITDMFASIKDYKNIRMALWWSSADYDMRPETYKQIARPYFLDETDETTAAFREGIQEYKKE